MSAEQLDKLEQLAGKRAEQTRLKLARETQALQQLDSHHQELRHINNEYQQEPVGSENVAPQQLAHRRAFVSQLTKKIEQLSEQKAVRQQAVEQTGKEYQLRSAQHTAIDVVNRKRSHEREQDRLKKEQRQLDDTACRQHFQNQDVNNEYDHE